MNFKLFFSITVLVLSISFMSCQSKSKFATARIFDIEIGINKPKIIVAYGDSEGEVIPLKEYGKTQSIMEHPERLESVMLENQKLINQFYQSMEEKGYQIQEMEMSVSDGQFIYIIFRKKG